MTTRLAAILPALACLLTWGLGQAQAQEMQTTASGLKYEIQRPGRADTQPVPGDVVVVHYTGTFDDGRVFDTSIKRGQPFRFPLGQGQVISGWDEGVALMTVGSKVRFHIPWALAYGEKGRGTIGPKTDLNFVIELLEVVPVPKFQKGDPAHQVTTASGLKYEVLAQGAGPAPRPQDGVTLSWVLWNPKGKQLVCSAQIGRPMAGLISTLGKGLGPRPAPFLKEAVLLMKPGARYRFEVPSNLCWGDGPAGPDLPAKSTTIWYLQLEKVNHVPLFEASPEAVLKSTKSGLKYEILRPGTGKTPQASDTVEVHYTGWLTDGTPFDSSHARGEPIEFPLSGVIPGWTEGVQLMKEGALYQFIIPGKLAYGPRGSPPLIGPNATLVFRIELIKVK